MNDACGLEMTESPAKHDNFVSIYWLLWADALQIVISNSLNEFG
jgi:hypothetical protein